MVLSKAQQRALAILPKCSSTLSMFGSLFLGIHVLRDLTRNHRKRQRNSVTTTNSNQSRKRPPNQVSSFGTSSRLLLSLSVVDFLTSGAYFCSTWPMPRNEYTTTHVYGAVGTSATCTAQGFFVQLGIAAAAYNACLSVHHARKVQPIKRKKKGNLWCVELLMHGVAWSLGLGTAVAGVVLGLYHPVELWCWIGGDSSSSSALSQETDCNHSNQTSDILTVCHESTTTTSHVNKFRFFRGVFYFYPLFVCVGITCLSLLHVYFTMLNLEQALDRYRFQGTTASHSRIRSRRVARQGVAYVLAFFLAWTFPVALQIVYSLPTTTSTQQQQPQEDGVKRFYWLWVMSTTLTPLQGFMNALIYLHPKCKSYWKKGWHKWQHMHVRHSGASASGSQENDNGNSNSESNVLTIVVPPSGEDTAENSMLHSEEDKEDASRPP